MLRLLPVSVGLKCLMHLKLIDYIITELPDSIDQLSSLRILFLDKNHFERIPESNIHLSYLYWLSISYCERLQSLPELTCDLCDFKFLHLNLANLAIKFRRAYPNHTQERN